ncbi:hypothetical protein F4782DRAFT_510721 [Xylaria castorea]|nr:hypothetical protein F4782DRAFT_510721 [Xylaria castorea]
MALGRHSDQSFLGTYEIFASGVITTSIGLFCSPNYSVIYLYMRLAIGFLALYFVGWT